MLKIETDKLEHQTFSDPEILYWIYNGFDCMVTREVFDALKTLVESRPKAKQTYEWLKCQQAVSLQLTNRGILLDESLRQEMLFEFRRNLGKLRSIFDQLCEAAAGKTVNDASPKQLQWLFYEQLKLPEQKTNFKGNWRVSTNRECLEKLFAKCDDERKAIVKVLLEIRDLEKTIQVLEIGTSSDGRQRASYNVAGTETLRWSSSETVFGEGTNQQNITKALRKLYIADNGYKMVQSDQEQAESRVVAYLSGDKNYIDACNSGDLHTYCCRLFWPKLPWTGDLAKDKLIAEQPYYRHFSYRDMSKRGGHASNYYATPWTIARHLKIPQRNAEEFQEIYFTTFSGIRRWHQETAIKLQTEGKLITPLGLERHFFGRPNDDATLREAIAFIPQSVVGQITVVILYRLLLLEESLNIKILGNGHDAALWELPDKKEDEIITLLNPQFSVPVTVKGVTFTIPVEHKVGYSWGDLEKWKGNGSTLKQERRKPSTALLDRIIL